MRHRDPQHHSAKNVVKYTMAEAATYYPDLNIAEVFRIDATSYGVTVGTPKNPRDGQYLRLEITSAAATIVNFSTAFHVDGAVISDGTHTADALVIYHGYYNSDTSKWNMIKLADKAA